MRSHLRQRKVDQATRKTTRANRADSTLRDGARKVRNPLKLPGFVFPARFQYAPSQPDDGSNQTVVHVNSSGVGASRASFIHAEFDPGSGRTLAACLMHASRTQRACSAAWRTAEEHVGINLGVGDTPAKAGTIPHTVARRKAQAALGRACGPSGSW